MRSISVFSNSAEICDMWRKAALKSLEYNFKSL